MTCAFSDDCRFYLASSSKTELPRWLDGYCFGSPDRCERLRRISAGTLVPDDLLPDGMTATRTERS
jgi:hypothetical protein